MLGQVSFVPNPSILSARIREGTSVVIQAGSVVNLYSGGLASGEVLIDGSTGPTNGPVWGVVIYNPRKNLHVAGTTVEVATEGSVVWLESSAAIARGAKVSSSAATAGNDPLVTTNVTSTQHIIGYALDEATAANQLIRIMIKPSVNP